jgi:alcohol dehydrogenase (cytochrome c)
MPTPPGKFTTYCTSSVGGRDWPATAFNAKTSVLYVPHNDICTDFTWTPGPDFDMRIRLQRRPNSDGMVGRVEAIDVAKHKALWVQRRRAPQIGSILGTAGGLIFEGDRDRWFRASDERTGKVLWQFRLNAQPSSSPITYSVDGVQYIAVTAGGGNPLEAFMGSVMAPEIPVPATGTTLWVFRLPDKK